jgi:hypothetical protein
MSGMDVGGDVSYNKLRFRFLGISDEIGCHIAGILYRFKYLEMTPNVIFVAGYLMRFISFLPQAGQAGLCRKCACVQCGAKVRNPLPTPPPYFFPPTIEADFGTMMATARSGVTVTVGEIPFQLSVQNVPNVLPDFFACGTPDRAIPAPKF